MLTRILRHFNCRLFESFAYSEKLTIALEKVDDLRYGENPHQSAAIYREMPRRKGLCDAIQLHGKQLSFNNYYDSQAAWQLVSTFEQPCAVAVKHSNPCGLGVVVII